MITVINDFFSDKLLVCIVWQVHDDIHNLREDINNNFILQVEMVNFKNTLNLFAFFPWYQIYLYQISLIRWLWWFWFTFWKKTLFMTFTKDTENFFLTQMNIFCPANLFKSYLKLHSPPPQKNKILIIIYVTLIISK